VIESAGPAQGINPWSINPENTIQEQVLMKDDTGENKVALITGGGGGIGEGLALSLGAGGYHVLVSDMDSQAAEQVAVKIIDAGGSAESLVLDVTQQSDIDTLADRFNRVDLLVNNAGIQHVAPLEDFPVDRWRLITEVLLIGPAMLTRAVLSKMRANNFGRIINIGSIHSLVASPYKSAYVAAKHGLIGFSKTVALEVADHDITINTICPSYVKTPLVEKQISDQAKAHGISEEEVINKIMLAPMPKKSFIEMNEIYACVAYLASAEACNMTAQSLVIDGAWTAR